LRIGVPHEYLGDGVEPGVRRAVEEALRWFVTQGAKTVAIELPNARLGVPVYYVIAPAEASANLARFDGVRYGHRAREYADLADMYARTRAEGFGAEVKQRILVGTYVLSHGYYDAYYLKAQKLRRLIARDFAAAFKRCDVIMGPTAPSTAFEIGAKTDDPVKMYLGDIFTVPAPLAGLPALSIPCGFDDAGLPVGLQLTGPHFSEAALLGVAARYQEATDWHRRLPSETPL
jgi:aspartyl-tRNA(Asn)/glutamyl-tRNA(Gln) amidotransferase subunit A